MALHTLIVGRGRAGTSFDGALRDVGWPVTLISARSGAIEVPAGTELVMLTVPDAAVAEVADRLETSGDKPPVVAHVSGSLGLDVLGRHARVASMHPLMSLPNGELGASRLRGCAFALAGDPVVNDVVTALDGVGFAVDDKQRTRYHAAATIASNHVVAILGQAARVAESADVDFTLFRDLVLASVEAAFDIGPSAALTGPAARGDDATLLRHLGALDPDERPAYIAGVELARRLVRDRG